MVSVKKEKIMNRKPRIYEGRVIYRHRPKDEWSLWAIRVGTKQEVLVDGEMLLADLVIEGFRQAQVRIVWENGKVQRVRLLSPPSLPTIMNPWGNVGIWGGDMGQPNPRDFSVLRIPEDPAKMAEMAQRIAAEGWKRVDELGQRHEPTLLDGAALDRNKMLYASVWKQIISAAKHLNKSRMAWALYRGGKGTVNWAGAPKGMMARELTHNVFGFHVHGHIALESVALVQPLEVLFNQRMFDEIVQKLQAEPATGKERPMFGQGAPFGTSWLRRQSKI